MSADRVIPVGLRPADLDFLMLAVYGNLDLTYEPVLSKAEELHMRLAEAKEALSLEMQADQIRFRVANPSTNAEPPTLAERARREGVV